MAMAMFCLEILYDHIQIHLSLLFVIHSLLLLSLLLLSFSFLVVVVVVIVVVVIAVIFIVTMLESCNVRKGYKTVK